jgi:sugar O-acyltransferase (sialic acid O-acetyltransferase NeuD family)
MKRLAVFGASGHGKVVAEIAELCGWTEIIFFDDDFNKTKLEKWIVSGDMSSLISKAVNFDGCFVAIGDNHIRSEKIEILISKGFKNLVSLVHPSAIVSSHCKIGIGTVIMAGSLINPFSKIGMASIINTGSIIEHDNFIEDFVHISPGVKTSGGVKIGNKTWVGTGSSIRQNLTIGQNVLVGIGSVVITNVPDNSIVFGVPAKKYKNKK